MRLRGWQAKRVPSMRLFEACSAPLCAYRLLEVASSAAGDASALSFCLPRAGRTLRHCQGAAPPISIAYCRSKVMWPAPRSERCRRSSSLPPPLLAAAAAAAGHGWLLWPAPDGCAWALAVAAMHIHLTCTVAPTSLQGAS